MAIAGDVIDHKGLEMASDLFDKYWDLRVQSADARLRGALEIIEHNPTRGALAEATLRDLIRDFLPNRWDLGGGFILSAKKKPTKQVDILLYDALSTAPLYRDGNLVVASPGMSAVAIEVKSRLNRDDLLDAMANIESVKRIDPAVVCVLFAFKSMTSGTLEGHLSSYLKAAKRRRSFDSALLPDKMYLLERGLLVHRNRRIVKNTFVGNKPAEPIVRFLLTQVLSNLKVTNLQPFMTADKVGTRLFGV
jgi:hypothetical protein